ncbi:MAG: putative sulfate exporter family transporter [Micavibrio aeruginosavorus]|uniref:Putative sulfate exporter family transporter n=1 Tax=Micavibrio aeruginosavorus TaxID=349221 RepID=A0A2W5FQU5_9BACT|nr:MAG: putative sulfate exporter family transporter [Micavibrio aeruginosavorus]
MGNPYQDKTKFYAGWLMAIGIVGLGAGVPLNEALRVGAHGIVYTLAGITFTFAVGLLIGKFLSLDKSISLLLTAGTAICGGSAIAAISRVIDARSDAVAISLCTVFLLNAAALIIFPFIGHALDLTQGQFGLWAGLAIHDTSSVIGAALQYGDEATQVATTTKLARAIWIIPLAFVIGLLWSKEEGRIPFISVIKRCWFIGGFLLMSLFISYVPSLSEFGQIIELSAKRLMVLVLFFIGTGLTRELLGQVGFKPFLQGITLWVMVSAATLAVILAGWISF